MVGYMNPWIYVFDADDVWEHLDRALVPMYSLPFNARQLEETGQITIDPEYGVRQEVVL